MQVILDDIWLCVDCTLYACNGDLTGLDYHYGDLAPRLPSSPRPSPHAGSTSEVWRYRRRVRVPGVPRSRDAIARRRLAPAACDPTGLGGHRCTAQGHHPW